MKNYHSLTVSRMRWELQLGDQRIGTLSTVSGYTINPTTGALAAVFAAAVFEF